jgi:hypothetical protein
MPLYVLECSKSIGVIYSYKLPLQLYVVYPHSFSFDSIEPTLSSEISLNHITRHYMLVIRDHFESPNQPHTCFYK